MRVMTVPRFRAVRVRRHARQAGVRRLRRALRARPRSAAVAVRERRAILEKKFAPAVRCASPGGWPATVQAFEAARERGLEGIVARDEASTYETGKRSRRGAR